MRDLLILTELNGERLNLALDLFTRGQSFIFNAVVFNRDSTGCVNCMAISQWNSDNLTEELAQNGITRAKDTYAHLRNSCNRFGALTRNAMTRYSLIDDYGMGCIEVCHEEDGKIVWSPGVSSMKNCVTGQTETSRRFHTTH